MDLKDYLSERGRTSSVAALLETSPAYLYQMATGRRPVPPELVPQIEAITKVRRWDLRPNDWHRIWPELAGTPGAPAVPVAQEA